MIISCWDYSERTYSLHLSDHCCSHAATCLVLIKRNCRMPATLWGHCEIQCSETNETKKSVFALTRSIVEKRHSVRPQVKRGKNDARETVLNCWPVTDASPAKHTSKIKFLHWASVKCEQVHNLPAISPTESRQRAFFSLRDICRWWLMYDINLCYPNLS